MEVDGFFSCIVRIWEGLGWLMFCECVENFSIFGNVVIYRFFVIGLILMLLMMDLILINCEKDIIKVLVMFIGY